MKVGDIVMVKSKAFRWFTTGERGIVTTYKQGSSVCDVDLIEDGKVYGNINCLAVSNVVLIRPKAFKNSTFVSRMLKVI